MNGSLDVAGANAALCRARRIETLRARYAGVTGIDSLESLRALPVLDKSDLARIAPEVGALARREGRCAFVFASGGTSGAPRLSFIPSHMFITDIVRSWRPLGPTDVFCNLFAAGKLWAAHHFYNTLGGALAGQTLPLGHVDHVEAGVWIDFLEAHAVTALAGTPSTLRELLRFCHDAGRTLPGIEKILWVGEPFDKELDALMRDVLPGAIPWGLYGSIETWVVGYNVPECAHDVFHVLPYQHVEIEDGLVEVTTTHPDCLNVMLRYRVGDAADWATCQCGRPWPALRVRGRADGVVKFRGSLVEPADLIRLAAQVAGVREAQVAVTRSAQGRERLELRVVRDEASGVDLAAIRLHVLAHSRDLDSTLDSDPAGFQVVAVSRLTRNPRTDKTPLVVRDAR